MITVGWDYLHKLFGRCELELNLLLEGAKILLLQKVLKEPGKQGDSVQVFTGKVCVMGDAHHLRTLVPQLPSAREGEAQVHAIASE